MLKPDATALPPTDAPATPDSFAHIYNVYKDMLKDKDAVIKEKDAKIEELHADINRLNRENGILQGQLKKPTNVHSVFPVGAELVNS